MSEIIPHDYDEKRRPGRRRSDRRWGIPGWAIALVVACLATCVAVFATVKVQQSTNSYRSDVYHNCLSTKAATVRFVDALTKLRDADQNIIDASRANEPATAFGKVDLAGIQQRVDAYNELLVGTGAAADLDCVSLRP